MSTANYTPANLSSAPASEIGLNVQNSNPPTAAYVGKDDSLWVMAATQNLGLVVTVNFRLLMPDGVIKLNQQAVRFAQSRQGSYQQINLPECFILSVGAVTNSTGSSVGQPYVSISLSRLSPSLFNAAQLLCAGYCQSNQPIAWPGGVNTTSVDCAGAILMQSSSLPAAGANPVLTVPSNAKWRLMSVRYSLTCSAVAGGRTSTLTIDDGSNILASVNDGGTHAAGTTTTWSHSLGFSGVLGISGTPTAIELPALILMPGYRIRTISTSLDVGDQFSILICLVEEWLLP